MAPPGRVTVGGVIPAQGYRADDIGHGPAAAVTLTLKSAEEEYAVTVTCDNGTPVANTAGDDGHHGRHRGKG